MKTIWKIYIENKKLLVVAILATLLMCTHSFLAAQLIVSINKAVSSPQNIMRGLLWVVLCFGASTFAELSSDFLRKQYTYNYYRMWATKLSDKILDADVSLFSTYSCAYVATILDSLGDLIGAGKMVLGMVVDIWSIVVVLYTSVQVAGWMMLPAALIYLLGIVIAKVYYPKYNVADKAIGDISKERNQEIENANYGFLEVRSFRKEPYIRRKISELNRNRAREELHKQQINLSIAVCFYTIEIVSICIVIYVSANRILSGQMTATDGITAAMLMFRLMTPVTCILNFPDDWSMLTRHTKDFENVMIFKNQQASGNLSISGFRDKIELKDVTFAYGDARDTLNNINMEFMKGQKTGICGESGGGKSTLLKLLNKLHKPQCGVISIDGTDIWDLQNESYRALLGSVHQENIMFPGSIRDNVVYGSPYAMDCEVVEACKKAHIYDFINSLPDKFETYIGPRGLVLSVGQKQRIALARLLLVNPEIILLDEATSALDNETEAFIQDAINSLEGKTIITVAHRLTTIQDCDKIYVIGNHGVVESGTHNELILKEGAYYRMHNKKGDRL